MMFAIIRNLLKPALRPLRGRFREDLRRPREAQQKLLSRLIDELSRTEYGRSLGVRVNDRYDDFAARVPVITYDDISPWVERQKREEGAVLVSEPVLFYEKSSGSSGPAKFIPYTTGLKASFNRMFLVWMGDLLESGPRFESGKVFISVSPAFRQNQQTERGVRVGLEDDSEYLAGWASALLKPFLIAPSAIRNLRGPDNFKHTLAALLLAESRLEAISVWSPTFLEVILSYIEENREALSADLREGEVAREGLRFKFKPASGPRPQLLEDEAIEWTQIWPDLKLISCWTSAHAAPSAHRLTEKFPGVLMQGKGLLATEAPLTLPLIEAGGFVPLPSEVFYEFGDEEGRISLLHELQAGREYDLILTQKGGLYRYRIGDRVRVTHFYEAAPCLEFMGRSDAVCDLVGEKLNERFIQEQLARLNGSGSFQTLLPVTAEPCYYLLITDSLSTDSASHAAELDRALCEAYHYRNARLLDQLAPAQVRVLANAQDIYYKHFMGKGMKWGDMKHQYLICNTDDAAKIIECVMRDA